MFGRLFKEKTKTPPDPDDTDPTLLKRKVDMKKEKNVEVDYEIFELLGSGRFGEVKRCVERSTQKEFAAKFVDCPSADERDAVNNEIKIMKKLRHARLLQLYDAYTYKSEMVIILELVTGGELFERVIDESFDLTEYKCEQFMREICQGVEYIHSQKVIHLDLKPENILCLTRSGFRIKIIDFGLARLNDKKDIRVMFGTPEFVAPEIISYEPVGAATDMWAVGVICYVLLSGLSPFMGENDGETFANILKVKYSFEYDEFENISDEAKNFISKLLSKDQKHRMKAREALNHSWLKNLEKTHYDATVNKKRLKHFVYRRKWQKAVNAIIALLRMGVNFSGQYPGPTPDSDSEENNTTTGPSTSKTNALSSTLEEDESKEVVNGLDHNVTTATVETTENNKNSKNSSDISDPVTKDEVVVNGTETKPNKLKSFPEERNEENASKQSSINDTTTNNSVQKKKEDDLSNKKAEAVERITISPPNSTIFGKNALSSTKPATSTDKVAEQRKTNTSPESPEKVSTPPKPTSSNSDKASTSPKSSVNVDKSFSSKFRNSVDEPSGASSKEGQVVKDTKSPGSSTKKKKSSVDNSSNEVVVTSDEASGKTTTPKDSKIGSRVSMITSKFSSSHTSSSSSASSSSASNQRTLGSRMADTFKFNSNRSSVVNSHMKVIRSEERCERRVYMNFVNNMNKKNVN